MGMLQTEIVAIVAVALAGCSATPQNGEKMEDGVRMQPVALSTNGMPANCKTHAVLMSRSRGTSDWTTEVQSPATIYLPRNARVVELTCTAPADGMSTTRFLASEEGAEAKTGSAATGAMFLLLGGLPALATGAAQRTDVYEFPGSVVVDMPPAASQGMDARKTYAERRTAEIERETAEWHKLRVSICKHESSSREGSIDEYCADQLAAIKQRKAELIAEVKAQQTAQN